MSNKNRQERFHSKHNHYATNKPISNPLQCYTNTANITMNNIHNLKTHDYETHFIAPSLLPDSGIRVGTEHFAELSAHPQDVEFHSYRLCGSHQLS